MEIDESHTDKGGRERQLSVVDNRKTAVRWVNVVQESSFNEIVEWISEPFKSKSKHHKDDGACKTYPFQVSYTEREKKQLNQAVYLDPASDGMQAGARSLGFLRIVRPACRKN